MRRINNSITPCFISGKLELYSITSTYLTELNYLKNFILTSESVLKLFFDILHGIRVSDVTVIVALELAIFLGYDGQLKQNSDMEKELFTSTIEQLMKTKMTKVENALMWLYVKSWNNYGQHVLDQIGLWNFGGEDLEAALLGLVYQGKKRKTERSNALNELIMERFGNSTNNFSEWSQNIYTEVHFMFHCYRETVVIWYKQYFTVYYFSSLKKSQKL